jgi:formylmethanofuran dehydrogenase subunit E
MTDKYIHRCSLCGEWVYTNALQRLQMLMGEQLMCNLCLKGKKNVA